MNYDLDTPEGMENSKQWLLGILRLISQNGSWFVPRSLTTLKIDKANKVATVVSYQRHDEALQQVFEAIGWTYKIEKA